MTPALAETEPIVAQAIKPTHAVYQREEDGIFALLLGAAYFFLELVNVLHHGMWRDEIQVWSLAQKCTSLRQFLTLKKYEDLGHPDLWHLLVYPVSRFTTKPIAMQLLHLAIATITAYVIARYAPFSRLQRILVVFGYFMFYEYATISRGYAIGVLCAFVFCTLFKPGPKKNYLALVVVLSAMAQANIQALMLATAFALMLAFEILWDERARQAAFAHVGSVIFSALLFPAAVLFSALRMNPPKDGIFYPAAHFPVDPTSIGRTFAMMWRSFVPVPRLSHQFWNSNIVPSQQVVAVLSIGILVVSFLFFLRKPVPLFAYTAGLGALLLFRHVKYAGYLRHDGHSFILFLACFWLACLYRDEVFPLSALDHLAVWFKPHANTVLMGLLAVQLAAALIASAISLKVPFSQARNVAEYLRANQMDTMYIVGDADAPVATVAGYLQRDVYYPRADRMGTYIIWDTKRAIYPKIPILDVGEEKAAEQHQDVLVILTHPSDVTRSFAHETARFTDSITGSEDFYIYRISYEHSSTNNLGEEQYAGAVPVLQNEVALKISELVPAS